MYPGQKCSRVEFLFPAMALQQSHPVSESCGRFPLCRELRQRLGRLGKSSAELARSHYIPAAIFRGRDAQAEAQVGLFSLPSLFLLRYFLLKASTRVGRRGPGKTVSS